MPHTDTPHAITFWYDPISPYAHLAFERLPQALMGLSVDLRYRPVLFAALLKAHGQLGPAEIPGKRDWTYRQVRWLAHHHGVRLDLPAAHPFNPLALLRLGLATAIAIDAATDDAPGTTNRYVTEQLFHHVWHGGAEATDPARLAALQALLQDHMAQRQRPWVEPDSDTVKQRLRDNTDAALAAGVFGVPTLACGGHLFWGQDALPMLRAYLEGDAWFQGP
ncbi:MAG: 2-hydroxychromene-2-carboxylate isomerase, partial [Hydrogenophaga sp.]|uniref:2-hydroxychromene-2-carboxylate isomerase n=1 Tax=Hydrogenophaga sp. TaxID=1904254 RepID=UPI003D9B551A